MKKLILSLLLASILLPSFAQSKIDFFDFVRDFDWNMSESDFRAKYKDRIIEQSDSLIDFWKEMPISLIALNNIQLGKYNTYTCITYFKQFHKPGVTAVINVSDPFDYIEIEKMIEEKLGKPIYLANKKTWVQEKHIYTSTFENQYGETKFTIVAQEQEPDFRQGYWGESMGEIKKKEGEPDKYGMKNIYMFDTYVAGLSCMAAYRFTNGILTSGKYIFTNINSDNCIENYETLVELLTVKYGEPGYNNKESSASELEKSTYTEGELVIANKMRLQTEWLTPSSYIIIALYGEEYQPMLVIEYSSNLHQEERAADILKDL